MASRMMHLAIAHLLAGEYEIGGRERFFLGTVIPDAVPKERSHFFKYIAGGRKTYDLPAFRGRYGHKLDDGLYLGFYMHLIEDIVFRDHLYHTVGYEPSQQKLPRFHHDYSLINRYIMEKYGITSVPGVPEGIADEQIVRDFSIDVPAFMEDMRGDLGLCPEGETLYYSREAADGFIARAVDVCGRELRALSGEGEHINEDSFSWKRHDGK
ncbi:MAG: hypothetical protein IKO27_06025 [Ruminococcus sp.]|nr:hypothetical protein [Ruminococcus sp.]